MRINRFVTGVLLLFFFFIVSNSGYADSLTVAVKNLNGTSASAVAFGVLPSSTHNKLAPQYLEVSFSGTYGPYPPVWGIDIYTNNTGANTGDGKGGLISSSGTERIAMVHVVYDTTQTGISDPPEPIADPWVYVIDKNDTGAYPWATQIQNNFPRIVYGFQNGDCFLSRNGTRCYSPVIVYLGGVFASKPTGDYSTTVYLDLYHL